MTPKFMALQLPAEKERLISFLMRDTWPFHVNSILSESKILKMLDEGLFDGSNHECFWILDGETTAGFLRVFDLDDIDDGFPLFDLRICSQYRGFGLGKLAASWLSKYLFGKYPDLDKIAGTTRSDNTPMRRIFTACGYVKEGHYRKDWPAADGRHHDTVQYSLLREDWVSGIPTPVHWNDQPAIDG